ADLIIEMEKTTCQCTVSDMQQGQPRKIAPGESVDVTLTWKPEYKAEKFNKGADFLTNDPKQPEHKILLRIVGMVAPRMKISPDMTWFIPNVADDHPSVFSGTVMSPVTDHFQIVAVESPSPLISTEIVPLEKAKLAEHNG